ncbi:phenylacetate-CoA oxygenase subunit PaaI [Flavipsychrobacter stenotrophus]|uniref:Phenylacetate-CoA oxygenase subunit PaaI n=1 Tax=Flavipsychrobacter stenotrophus TaxID=2077091 RepID=A0A2S7SX99_9BACT|nr:1,2-phenylacetyl-CoA epoxidase subunit PaaC [Flavipsychrobacter stenotrophus]PQJ11338.1 phenylacetate-CoA oxygenase subunit PaaI [Flavipsychrobacter stenotrophus]
MTEQQALYKYSLRLGDNALILSARLSEWCSNAPFLEEDLAVTNMALDLIGRAQAMLKYAGEVDGNSKTEDDLAYRRGERDYYNNLIMELPNGDFAYTMVRQLFVSTFELFFYEELQKSTDATLAAIAAKTLKEVKYHHLHAKDWVIRLGDGTEESNRRVQQAVNQLWMYTGELFEMDGTDALLMKDGIAVNAEHLKMGWIQMVTQILALANIELPADGYMQSGSRMGIHTEHLGHILSEMQYLQRAYPDATW